MRNVGALLLLLGVLLAILGMAAPERSRRQSAAFLSCGVLLWFGLVLMIEAP